VILLYVAVNFVCLYVLGADRLARTETPASTVMSEVLPGWGAPLIALGITISTLGFLSQSMLTAPRVYFAMAEDGLFFQGVARLSKKTRVPVVAIILQGIFAMVIALSGRYPQILNYVVSVDFIWFGLTAAALIVLRSRDVKEVADRTMYRVPGHPWTTIAFIVACWLIVAGTVYQHPANSAIGFVILLAGIPAYLFWRSKSGWQRKPS
jgi:basic amino acid/polyamine antiporter, APA family